MSAEAPVIALLRRPLPGGSRPTESKTLAVTLLRLKIFLSYRYFFVVELMSIVSLAAVYYFVGFQVRPEALEEAGYGRSYIGFALVGVAASHFLYTCISRIGHIMTHELMTGTFEAVMSTPVKHREYVVGQALVGFVMSGYLMAGVLLAGVLLLGAPLVATPGSIGTAIVFVLLLMASHLGIGIFAAGILMVHKKGDPITFILDTLTQLFAGVLFPLSLLKGYPLLEGFSRVLPFTYVLEGLRKSLLTGATLAEPGVARAAGVLVLATVILIPLGMLSFHRGFDKVRRLGLTGSY
ncbi:MAG: ABC transporter permease [Euryarchaeota archaeon]|nr:ABC transporter permease [Euryarchaeota archaeon]